MFYLEAYFRIFKYLGDFLHSFLLLVSSLIPSQPENITAWFRNPLTFINICFLGQDEQLLRWLRAHRKRTCVLLRLQCPVNVELTDQSRWLPCVCSASAPLGFDTAPLRGHVFGALRLGEHRGARGPDVARGPLPGPSLLCATLAQPLGCLASS